MKTEPAPSLPEWNSLDSAANWLSAVTGTTWNSMTVLDGFMNVAFAVAPEGTLDHAKFNSEKSNPEEGGTKLSGPPMAPDGLFPLTFIQVQCVRTRGYVTVEHVDFSGRIFDLDLEHRFRISTNDVRILSRDLKLFTTRGLEDAQPSGSRPNGKEAIAEDSRATTAKNRGTIDIHRQRGARRRILEGWNGIENEYGQDADGVQVKRFLDRDKAAKSPNLKTVQNILSKLRRENLIP